MKWSGKTLVVFGVAALAMIGVGAWLALRGEQGPLHGAFNHDFGAVLRDADEVAELRHVFKLTNKSDEPVRVLMARPDCSCVTARQGLPATVMPGDTLELPVIMRLEAFKKNVTIFLELADDTQQKLTVSASTKFLPRVWFWEPQIAITPGRAIDHPFSVDYFGTDTPPTPEIEVPDGFGCTFALTGWRPVQPSEWPGVRPSIWRGELHIEPPAQAWPEGATLKIKVGDSSPLEIPLTVADAQASSPAQLPPGNPPATLPAGR